jgi:hypothetical protein
MALTKILVDRSAVIANHQNGTDDPIFKVLCGDVEQRASAVTITGPCEVRYDRTAVDGKRVWIETRSSVVLRSLDDRPASVVDRRERRCIALCQALVGWFPLTLRRKIANMPARRFDEHEN